MSQTSKTSTSSGPGAGRSAQQWGFLPGVSETRVLISYVVSLTLELSVDFLLRFKFSAQILLLVPRFLKYTFS